MKKARMHSSGMRTARLLTVSQHALCRGVSASGPGGVFPGGSVQGVSARGDVWPGGCLPLIGGGCIPACNGADTPCGQTDTCKNNLHKLRLRAVKIDPGRRPVTSQNKSSNVLVQLQANYKSSASAGG